MIQSCEFDSVRDVQAVEQSGAVDLARANALSSIPAQISASDLSYNDIDDPNSIGGRPSDVFEAAQMSSVIAGYKAPNKNDSSE